MAERLQKYLAAAGIASRRKSELLITSGRVKVNGSVVTQLGTKVDPDKDEVTVDGKPALAAQTFVYYALNKPRGFTTTVADPHAKRTVLELVPETPRVFPVGRLDKESEGLLILTNDGELAQQLTHPKFAHEKEYRVELKFHHRLSDEQMVRRLERLIKGILLDRQTVKVAALEIEETDSDHQTACVRITLKEGKKRQIRRMTEVIGADVVRLLRIRIEQLNLDDIDPGDFITIDKSAIIPNDHAIWQPLPLGIIIVITSARRGIVRYHTKSIFW